MVTRMSVAGSGTVYWTVHEMSCVTSSGAVGLNGEATVAWLGDGVEEECKLGGALAAGVG
jgi:hypothetical protein